MIIANIGWLQFAAKKNNFNRTITFLKIILDNLNNNHSVFSRNSINIEFSPNRLLCFHKYPQRLALGREAATAEAHSEGSGLRSRTCVFHVAA